LFYPGDTIEPGKINLTCTAFSGRERISSGGMTHVALEVKKLLEKDAQAQVLVFDDATSELIELDLRGSSEDVVRRLAVDDVPRKPGRPKLGVVPREVTLLPRHWEWLAGQPGGASVALRKLVERARTADAGSDRRRKAQESAYRFLSAMAGNEPGFEEAARALFAGRRDEFDAHVSGWPVDVREHARKLMGAIEE
jgi:uncharacterized protein